MCRWLAGVLAVIAGVAVVPGSAFGLAETATRFSPRNATATCLRAPGQDGTVALLGRLRRRDAPIGLFRAGPTGITPLGEASLGIPQQCPTVAAAGGRVLVAGAAGHQRIRAAILEPGTWDASPVDVGRYAPSTAPFVSAAISPSGDAVVAWREVRFSRRDHIQTRVMAATRAPGAAFAPARALTAWRNADGFGFARALATTVDAHGSATVAYGRPEPPSESGDSASIQARRAARGGHLGRPQRLARRAYDVRTIAIAQAPDGGLLLAHDGAGAIQTFERPPDASRFRRGSILRRGSDEATQPAVALLAGGAAIVAWRNDDFNRHSGSLAVVRRLTPGRFSRPELLGRPRESGSLDESFYGRSAKPFAPQDTDGLDPTVTLARDGRALLSVGATRRSALGDAPFQAYFASGSLRLGFGRRVRMGCPCRAANGAATTIAPGVGQVALWSDNLSRSSLTGDDALAGRSGRLHLAVPAARPRPEPAVPRLSIRGPRKLLVRFGDQVSVRARCNRPCDLRAVARRRAGRLRRTRAVGLATATDRRGGRTRVLRVSPGDLRSLAPPQAGAVSVTVRAWAIGGRRFSQRRLRLAGRRVRAAIPPRPLNVRARRRHGRIYVSWQTARRPIGGFQVELLRRRRGDEIVSRFFERHRGHRFHATFRDQRGARLVGVTSLRSRSPDIERQTVVPIL